MPAPTLAAFAQAEALVASGVNVTTASISWLKDDVVIVFAATAGAPSGGTLNTPTTTGSGISFGSAQQIHNSAGSDPGGGCWAAVATAGSSGTFSVNETHVNTQDVVIGVYIVRGSAGIGNSAISTGSSRTVNLTPTAADGLIGWVVADWAAAAVQSFTPATTSHGSSSPGPTASPYTQQIVSQVTFYIGELDDQTSAALVAYGIGGSGTGAFTIIAIEAKVGAAGSGASSPPDTYLPGASLLDPTADDTGDSSLGFLYQASPYQTGAVGQQFTAAFAGSSTPTGTLTNQTNKPLVGQSTPSGGLTRQTAKALAGASTPTGVNLRTTLKALAGSSIPTGVLTVTRLFARAFAGSSTPTGTLTRQTLKALAGSSAPAGALTRLTLKSLAASSTPTGVLSAIRLVVRTFTGSSTPTGALTNKTLKAFSGASTPTGALAKLTGKALTGRSTPTGILATTRLITRLFTGSSTPTGTLTRQTAKALSGASTPTGTLAKRAQLALHGLAASSGVLTLLLNPSQAATTLRIRLHGREPGPTSGSEHGPAAGREPGPVSGRLRWPRLRGRRGGNVSGREDGT